MTQRRYDLDWLRIAAFAILILYHCGMFQVTWGWQVKQSHAGPLIEPLIEPLMQLANPWRLTLLFLISGAASRFMADKMASGAFLKARIGRLWPPLLLAVFVIVLPQSCYEVLQFLQTHDIPQSPWQARAAILSVIGFFHHHFRERDTPLRRMLSRAIFPFYLIHQIITVTAGHRLDRLGLPVIGGAPLLIGATALGSGLFCGLGRRVPPLRIWIGLPSGKGGRGAP